MEETFAQRLRGIRFWIPLAVLMLAGLVAFYILERDNSSSSVVLNPGRVAALDPVLQRLIQRLEVNGFVCGNLTDKGSNEASCVINQDSAPIDLASFRSHPQLVRWVKGEVGPAKTSFAVGHTVTYVVTGNRWAFAGTWSASGGYQDSSSPDAKTAQDLTRLLNGCLELLPKEAGSCGF